jgi:hypothetical protein
MITYKCLKCLYSDIHCLDDEEVLKFVELCKRTIRMMHQNLFSWIKVDSQQLAWLINYLQQRIPTILNSQTSFSESNIEQIIVDIKAAKSNDSLVLFMAKTKAAWKQYERRIKRQKSYVTTTLEISKGTHTRVVNLAKKYKIPVNIAIEELVKKACEIEDIQCKSESSSTSLKNKIVKLRKVRTIELNLIEKEPLSKEDICNKLMEEMYQRHLLENQLIKLAVHQNSVTKQEEFSKEKSRYFADCTEYEIDTID